jgi:hypothetical protein
MFGRSPTPISPEASPMEPNAAVPALAGQRAGDRRLLSCARGALPFARLGRGADPPPAFRRASCCKAASHAKEKLRRAMRAPGHPCAGFASRVRGKPCHSTPPSVSSRLFRAAMSAAAPGITVSEDRSFSWSCYAERRGDRPKLVEANKCIKTLRKPMNCVVRPVAPGLAGSIPHDAPTTP